MISRLFVFSVLLAVTACARPDIHLETQKVTIKTPGANVAKCYLENQEYKYVAYNDQTITMTRTSKDMDVTCYAEGNRVQTVKVSPDTFPMTMNTNKIPEVITVDFKHVAAKPYPLPDYHDQGVGKYPLPTEVEYLGPTEVDGLEEPFQEEAPLNRRRYGSSNPFSDDIVRDAYDPREEDK